MDEQIYISICHSDGGIRLFRETVRCLNTPPYVKFYINYEKFLLAVVSENSKSQKTHRIPKNLYVENGRMVVYSKRLCDVLYREMKWDKTIRYRVPGKMMLEDNAAYFELKKAEILK